MGVHETGTRNLNSSNLGSGPDMTSFTKTFTNYRESHQGRGEDYHRTFTDVPHRAVLWQLEREFLHRLVGESGNPKDIRLLDFACGTGRIIGALEDRVGSAVGVDISQSMLDYAKGTGVRSPLICGDVTAGQITGIGPFDMITAFRFFPNAEPELRNVAMNALVSLMAPGGRLVLNNHLNESSTVFRVLRLFKKPFANEAVPESEILDLIERHGLRVERKFHTGVAPFVEHVNLLPKWALLPLERVASRVVALEPLAQDIVYVCVKK